MKLRLRFTLLKKMGFGQKYRLLRVVLLKAILNIKEAAEGWLDVAAMRTKGNNQIQVAEIEL